MKKKISNFLSNIRSLIQDLENKKNVDSFELSLIIFSEIVYVFLIISILYYEIAEKVQIENPIILYQSTSALLFFICRFIWFTMALILTVRKKKADMPIQNKKESKETKEMLLIIAFLIIYGTGALIIINLKILNNLILEYVLILSILISVYTGIKLRRHLKTKKGVKKKIVLISTNFAGLIYILIFFTLEQAAMKMISSENVGLFIMLWLSISVFMIKG